MMNMNTAANAQNHICCQGISICFAESWLNQGNANTASPMAGRKARMTTTSFGGLLKAYRRAMDLTQVLGTGTTPQVKVDEDQDLSEKLFSGVIQLFLGAGARTLKPMRVDGGSCVRAE